MISDYLECLGCLQFIGVPAWLQWGILGQNYSAHFSAVGAIDIYKQIVWSSYYQSAWLNIVRRRTFVLGQNG
jgi:hypothetical protein